jgi:hypothetical protein
MNERLGQINQSLRALDDAYHGGRIGRDDYRARRRRLLGILCDSHGITARHAVDGVRTDPRSDTRRDPARARPADDDHVLPVLLRAGSGVAWRPWLVLGAVVVLALALGYLLLGAG